LPSCAYAWWQSSFLGLGVVLQQFWNKVFSHSLGTCFSSTLQWIFTNSQIEATRCIEISMSSQIHYVIFRKAISKPLTEACAPQAVELTVFDSSVGQHILELPRRVVNRAVALIEFPPTFLTRFLYAAIPYRRYENIGKAAWKLFTVMRQQLVFRGFGICSTGSAILSR